MESADSRTYNYNNDTPCHSTGPSDNYSSPPCSVSLYDSSAYSSGSIGRSNIDSVTPVSPHNMSSAKTGDTRRPTVANVAIPSVQEQGGDRQRQGGEGQVLDLRDSLVKRRVFFSVWLL